MISTIISRLVILLFGTLYPAYASYKAVKTKNLKEYVKWMMYWIVFALFTCIETFTDVLLSWFPFYYEIKVVLVLFLLSPGTMGSSVLYRKIVHPLFSSKEQEIDDYISRAKEQSYKQVLDLGSKGMTVLMMTAIKTVQMVPATLQNSISDPSLSSTLVSNHNNDEMDCEFKRSATAPDIAHSSVVSSEDDDDATFVPPPQVEKKARAKKARGKSGTRKSNRKTVKAETFDPSD